MEDRNADAPPPRIQSIRDVRDHQPSSVGRQQFLVRLSDVGDEHQGNADPDEPR